MRLALVCALAAGLALPGVAAGKAAGDAGIAALQVGLRAHAAYDGDVDGFAGPQTSAALRRLSGAAGPFSPQTRAALGAFGAYELGDRRLALGLFGFDVAALQFLLAWHGFPSGTLDGEFGLRTDGALRRYQAWAGLPPTGIAASMTLAALRGPVPVSPVRLRDPIGVPHTDDFGPRGARFHAGLDYPAPTGAAVVAAGDGIVAEAGWRDGSFGRVVVLEHAGDVRTLYAHLSETAVRPGQRVSAGTLVGRAGATGAATGPHLHFEVHVRGAAVDPLSALR